MIKKGDKFIAKGDTPDVVYEIVDIKPKLLEITDDNSIVEIQWFLREEKYEATLKKGEIKFHIKNNTWFLI